MMKAFRVTLTAQATYILITALWPLIHIESFIYVTGPKDDIWLVKTIGALLLPIALCMFSFLREDSDKIPAIILGGGTAIAFVSIDVFYTMAEVISLVYLADAFVEFVFLMAWIYIATHRPAQRKPPGDGRAR